MLRIFFLIVLLCLNLFLVQCKTLSVGGFDIKYGTGSEVWDDVNGEARVSRGNAYRDYHHDKWR